MHEHNRLRVVVADPGDAEGAASPFADFRSGVIIARDRFIALLFGKAIAHCLAGAVDAPHSRHAAERAALTEWRLALETFQSPSRLKLLSAEPINALPHTENTLMDRKAVSDHIKEILELTRNVAFACGIVVILGTVVYHPESIGVHRHATIFRWIVALIGFGYVALSVLQYELRYPVNSEKPWVRAFVWICRFGLLVTLSEGAFLAVANHTDWAQAHALGDAATTGQDKH